jgi:hypothetical protein
VGSWEACGEQFFSRELVHELSWRDMGDLSGKR